MFRSNSLRKMQLWNITGRFYTAVLVGVAALAALAFYGSATISTLLMDSKKDELRNLAEAVISIVADYDARASRGEMSLDDAKRNASLNIRALRYEKKEYFFILDYDNMMVMHPINRALEGKDQSNLKDSNGVNFTKAMIDQARAGGGFVFYEFPKPGDTQPFPKVSYSVAYDKWGWVIGTGVYVDEVEATAAAKRNVFLAFVVASTLALMIIAFFLGRSISQPIKGLIEVMQALAGGRLNVPVEGTARRDEIGTMANAVQVFKDEMIAKQKADEAAAHEADAKARRAQRLDELAKSFEMNVSTLTQGLSRAASDMEATAQTMASTAEQTNVQSANVASAAEQASSNVQTVAAATEELSISTQEIASQVAHSAQIAGSAVEDAKRTDVTVQKLAETAEKIGNVIALINTIASQTNLLALNATIEAARAGEAGKGFAVVATEVKELAGQTTKATDEIASQIAEIQQATRQAVTAIRTIGDTIGNMSNASTAIAAAIEEQGAATREIARNVQEAARGTEAVTGNIVDVRQGASQTGAAASQVLDAARTLTEHSSSLSREVQAFLSNVKAA